MQLGFNASSLKIFVLCVHIFGVLSLECQLRMSVYLFYHKEYIFCHCVCNGFILDSFQLPCLSFFHENPYKTATIPCN